MQPITITLSYADAVTIMQVLDVTGDCPDAVEALKAALDEECPACVEED